MGTKNFQQNFLGLCINMFSILASTGTGRKYATRTVVYHLKTFRLTTYYRKVGKLGKSGKSGKLGKLGKLGNGRRCDYGMRACSLVPTLCLNVPEWCAMLLCMRYAERAQSAELGLSDTSGAAAPRRAPSHPRVRTFWEGSPSLGSEEKRWRGSVRRTFIDSESNGNSEFWVICNSKFKFELFHFMI